MEKYTNEYGKTCFKGVSLDSTFSGELFHKPEYQPEGDESFALHTNLGSLTVLDRLTGWGDGDVRDTESGFRDPAGNFWLASCDCDVRESGSKTIGEAIQWIKDRANTCVPSDEDLRAIQ
jgi:hypothetical protein